MAEYKTFQKRDVIALYKDNIQHWQVISLYFRCYRLFHLDLFVQNHQAYYKWFFQVEHWAVERESVEKKNRSINYQVTLRPDNFLDQNCFTVSKLIFIAPNWSFNVIVWRSFHTIFVNVYFCPVCIETGIFRLLTRLTKMARKRLVNCNCFGCLLTELPPCS